MGAYSMQELGATLRAWRKARNMSIYDVERRTGIRFSLVSAYERGEKNPPCKTRAGWHSSTGCRWLTWCFPRRKSPSASRRN